VIGLDTNVLARYFVEEEGADPATQTQRQAARQLIESGQKLFLPKTVALRWVPFIGQFRPLTSLTPGGRNRV
jgi:predicted nucleic-acid-binding protein